MVTEVPDRFHVAALSDPVYDTVGHDVRSVYCETFWLPVVGPSALWVARRLVSILDIEPAGFTVDADDLAAEIGLRASRASSLGRVLHRLAFFDAARWDGSLFEQRLRLATIPGRQLRRLPAPLVAAHNSWANRQAVAS